jgi:hypothetical protein
MYKMKKDLIDGSDLLVKVDQNAREYFIPFDPDNTDYQAYLAWLAEGNEPEPAEGAE